MLILKQRDMSLSLPVNGTYGGFTEKYGVRRLVCYEELGSMEMAINRAKVLKKWKRECKIALIEKMNPHGEDLFSKLAR